MQGLVCGKYRLIKRLDKGGMAEVWVAEHMEMRRSAAIKLLLPHMLAEPKIVHRFHKEARAAASIDNAGIVKIYDQGITDDGRAYIAMELLNGESLGDRLKRERTLSIEQSKRFVRQLAAVMEATHAEGIIHRDLKPDNIFIVKDAEVMGGERLKVLDFGLAKQDEVGSMATAAGDIFGTPKYMAPEQCRGAGGVDGRADLYAIGCIFYHCLCGQPPFDMEEAVAVFSAQLYTIPQSPRALRAEIPLELESLILRLLAKQPENRVQTCSQLMAALKRHTGTAAMLDDDDEMTIVSSSGFALPWQGQVLDDNRPAQLSSDGVPVVPDRVEVETEPVRGFVPPAAFSPIPPMTGAERRVPLPSSPKATGNPATGNPATGNPVHATPPPGYPAGVSSPARPITGNSAPPAYATPPPGYPASPPGPPGYPPGPPGPPPGYPPGPPGPPPGFQPHPAYSYPPVMAQPWQFAGVSTSSLSTGTGQRTGPTARPSRRVLPWLVAVVVLMFGAVGGVMLTRVDDSAPTPTPSAVVRQAPSLDPGKLESLLLISSERYRETEYDKARDACRAALHAGDRGHLGANRWCAMASCQLGDGESAERYYKYLQATEQATEQAKEVHDLCEQLGVELPRPQ